MTEIYIENDYDRAVKGEHNHWNYIAVTGEYSSNQVEVVDLRPLGNGKYLVGEHSVAHRNYLKTLKRVTNKEVIEQITKILTR